MSRVSTERPDAALPSRGTRKAPAWGALVLLSLLAAACGRGGPGPAEASSGTIPVGVVFKEGTIARQGFFGDHWCQTWAADDNICTMLDDGNG